MGIKKGISHSFWIMWKDLLEFERRKIGLVMFVLMPLIMMAMIGFIFPSGNALQNAPVALVNQDNGEWSSRLVMQLELINNKTGLMKFENAGSFEEARGMIIDGTAQGAIIIPENFSSILSSGQQGTVTTLTDQSNPQLSLALSEILNKVLGQISTYWAEKKVGELAENVNPAAVIRPYSVKTENIAGGTVSYFDFMAPGLMVMVVIMSVLTGMPRAIAYERDVGTLNGFLVAPISRLSIISGKALARIIRGLLQGLIVLFLAIVLFGVTIRGSILSVFFLLFLGVFSFIGLSIVLTSIAEDEETAGMIMMTLTLPMLFLSGMFFPVSMMPGFMQTIAYCLPFVYLVDALRKVMIFGVGLGAVALNIFLLLGFGVVMLAIAVPVFRKAMSR
jgi:ABC-2 type transport system permease protein